MGEWNSARWITDQDRRRSRTSHDLTGLRRALRPLDGTYPRRILDIGCGFGGLAALVSDFLGATEVHGVDIDQRVVAEARAKGVEAVVADAGQDRLPYQSGQFDFVMTLGMMDYLPSFDGMIREMHRVLAPGGSVLVALPNLSSWHNRAMMCFGFQPRDVEVSSEVLVGVPRHYKATGPVGHIHIPTLRAFKELMTHHGFQAIQVTGGTPDTNSVGRLVRIADATFGKRVSLARRFYYHGEKLFMDLSAGRADRSPGIRPITAR